MYLKKIFANSFLLVPELVEGEKAKHSPRRLFACEECGEGGDMALLIPFDKLRDQT
jgi:hypothetical protein